MNDPAGLLLTFVGKVPYSLGAPIAAMGYSAAKRRADCSSAAAFVVKAETGLDFGRTADAQYKATERFRVPLTNLRRNDLLFFGLWNNPSNPPGYAGVQHVAIALGGLDLVEEGGTTDNVNVARLSAFRGHLLYATRPFSTKPVPPMPTPEADMLDVTFTPGQLGTLTTDGKPDTRGLRLDTTAGIPIPKTLRGVSGLFVKVRNEAAYLASVDGAPVAILAHNATFVPDAPVAQPDYLAHVHSVGGVLTITPA